MVPLACVLLAALVWLAVVYAQPQQVSPDGERYVAMAVGVTQPSPFHRRWILPAILGKDKHAWRAATGLALCVTAPAMAGYVGGPWWKQLAAAALFCGLPGVFRLNVFFPILVDAPALLFALGSALAWRTGQPVWAVAFVLMAGAMKESSPIFAAIYAWTPWLLVGLVAARWWGASKPDGDKHSGVGMVELVRRTWGWHDPLQAATFLVPWGALAVLFPLGCRLDVLTAQALLALAVGYGQLLIATDRSRLFQWAAPCVIAVALRGDWSPWLTVACVVHPFNPYRGS